MPKNLDRLPWLGLSAAGLWLGCQTASPQLHKTPRTQAEILECEIRLTQAAQSEQAMRASSPREQLGRPMTADPQPVRWGQGNNPCRQSVLASQSESAHERERQTRQMAKLKAQAALSQGQLELAFDALRSAFQAGAEPDAQLWELAGQLEPAYIAQPVEGAQAACAFYNGPRQAQEATRQLRAQGMAPVHVRCALPEVEGLEPQSAQGWLVLRRRVALGQYELLLKQPLGAYEALRAQAMTDTAWSPESAQLQEPHAYIEATLLLIDARGQQRQTRPEGLFWFQQAP